MAWTIFQVPASRRSELDEILREDRIARQSQKIRDAGVAGGPAGSLYVQLSGNEEIVRDAEERLRAIGEKPPAGETERLRRLFTEEDDSASAGMGLFFTE